MERDLVETLDRAQKLVMAGRVIANGERMVTPGQMVRLDVPVELRDVDCPFVSRGGFKLQQALDEFEIDLNGKRCLDLGACTGGFTDLMLQRGAASVTAVDVGKGQLHWKLRNDPRVTMMEKTNARYLTLSDFPQPFDFLTGDLSFIGLNLILPVAFGLANSGAEAVFLIKPQFEARREQVEKGGVVRDPEVHREVLLRVLRYDFTQYGFYPRGLGLSPIKGAAGNQEYLVYYGARCEKTPFCLTESVERVVERTRGE